MGKGIRFLALVIGASVAMGGITALVALPNLSQTQSANPQIQAQADQFLEQGLEQYNNSQFEAALQSWQAALKLYRKIGDRSSEGQVLFNVGTAYDALSEYDQAIEYYKQTLAIAKKLEDQVLAGDALLNLGIAYYALNEYDQAIKHYEQALAIARELQDQVLEGNALLNLGAAHNVQRKYDQAIKSLEQSLTIARELQDQMLEGDALLNLGYTYGRQGKHDQATEYLEQSLAIAQRTQNRVGERQALTELGTVYYSMSSYAKAIKHYDQALVIAQDLKDQTGEERVLNALGDIYYSLHNATKALNYYQQSLAIAQESKNRLKETHTLERVGLTYGGLSNYDKSIEYLEQALTIAQQIKNQDRQARLLGYLGGTYLILGNPSKAVSYMQQALAITRQTKNQHMEAWILGWLGNVDLALYQNNNSLVRNPFKAVKYYEQQLAIEQKLKNRKAEAQTLGILSSIYVEIGHYPKAIAYLEQALAIKDYIKDQDGKAEILTTLGIVQFKLNQFSRAEQNLWAAIKIYESLREQLPNIDKAFMAGFQHYPYRTLEQLLIAQNKVNLALEVAERGRTKAFVELLAKRVQSTNTPLTTISIAEIQQVAKNKQATIVEYSFIRTWNSQLLFIWVVQPSGTVHFRQVDLTPLSKKQNTSLGRLIYTARCLGVRSCEQHFAQFGTRQVLFNISRLEQESVPVWNHTSSSNQYLKQLHELLIQPIADLLPKDPNAPIVFIPQASLFLVPFAALQDAQNNYLIDRHTILTAPSIQVLQLTQQQRQKLKQAGGRINLVVGNPTMPKLILANGKTTSALPALPAAETEAKVIASLLNTQPLIGSQATKAEIIRRMPQARIIHLATHGVFNDQEGLQSAVALAPLPEDATSGWLTADEILDLQLSAELVVLSACDTGQGRSSGDGLIGLSRSLISSGVPSVVVSLWAVPDAPTALLMTQFYQTLQQQPNKAVALRQAMLNTKKQHPHPKDWAGFVLIGEME